MIGGYEYFGIKLFYNLKAKHSISPVNELYEYGVWL